jgi:poly(3-hydroxybutyrate) depolymerase
MPLSDTKLVHFLLAGFLYLSGAGLASASSEQTKRAFTVTDDIEITLFRVVGAFPKSLEYFSPDGNYFAVYTERGRLDLNCVEDELRFYRSRDVEEVLEHSEVSPPLPIWVLTRSGKEGPIINDWRWLPDSSGVVFLEGGGNFSDKRLVLADLGKKGIERLTSAAENVADFDIRDRQHYVYTVTVPAPLQKSREEKQAAIVGTGRSISQLLFPDGPQTPDMVQPPSYLWAVAGSKRFEVRINGAPFAVAEGHFALSPDGQSLVTRQTVSEVPASWETLYPSPFASSPYRFRAGHQHLEPGGQGLVSRYVRIHLRENSVQVLTEAPESYRAGWWSGGLASPSWSADGQAILLPGTFIARKDQLPSRPCVVVVDLESNTRSCVEMLTGPTGTGIGEEDDHFVKDVRFIAGDKRRVMVDFSSSSKHPAGSTEYRNSSDGTWYVVGQTEGNSQAGRNGLEIRIEEALDQPPLLIARRKQVSRIIWDPNPQLKNIELGQADLYRWKDNEGREWKGGLYKPSSYRAGRRYPLVIQTHGFIESYFAPSGFYSTSNAARELTAAGMLVLQVEDGDCSVGNSHEGPCAVSRYQSAANQLISEGLVDPERIGITGFSRTCFYVMETLTTGSLHPRAASVTDGPMEDYWQFISYVDLFPSLFNSTIGAPPFGAGLQQWLKRSPTFNLDKVTAPLLVVGEGIPRFLLMWPPYAGLRYLQKPVDFIILNTHEHVVTNPAVRVASQGGSVDWFRFWLQDYEDPDPAKVEQYERWRELRRLQQKNEQNLGPRPSLN